MAQEIGMHFVEHSINGVYAVCMCDEMLLLMIVDVCMYGGQLLLQISTPDM